jgi:hypothetical protein
MSWSALKAVSFAAGVVLATLSSAQAGTLIRDPLLHQSGDSIAAKAQYYPMGRRYHRYDEQAWQRERERRAEDRRRHEEAELQAKREHKAAEWKRRAEEAERRAAYAERRRYGHRRYGGYYDRW